MIKAILKAWGQDEWVDITDNISGDLPELSDNDVSSLGVFDIEFKDTDDQLLTFETGYDLALIELDDDENLLGIYGEKMYGKIKTIEVEPNFIGEYDENDLADPQFTYKLTIEQRDFSTIPFELDYEGVKSASAIVTKIFEQYVRKELGGVLSGGTVIDRFEITCDDYDLLNFKNKGTARRQLNEVCSRASWAWELIGVIETHETNNYEILSKVRIWQE